MLSLQLVNVSQYQYTIVTIRYFVEYVEKGVEIADEKSEQLNYRDIFYCNILEYMYIGCN